MSEIRNICLIDVPFPVGAGFERAGCTVLNLLTRRAPFFSLPEALAEHGFTPDLVVQCEVLNRRTVVTGLDEMDCPLIYWGVDPHLNAHWQSAYARLFDMTCVTQRKVIPDTQRQGAKDVRWLPWYGRKIDIADGKREFDLAFVGRVTEQRPARKWMLEYLERKWGNFNLAIRDGLDFGGMMELYRSSRIIPNESILGEVNFRLFEAASCGCLVLGQALGDEQEELFRPGREFDTYADIVEMDSKLRKYMHEDRLTQAMGRAAHERVQREHLPEHRAQRLLEYARDAVRHRATGPDSIKWQTLAICGLWEAGMHDMPAGKLLSELAELPLDAEVAEAAMRVQAAAGMTAGLEENIRSILGGQLFVDSPECNLAGSMATLRAGNWDAAKTFWYRHLQSTGARQPRAPEDSVQLLTLWAKDLSRRERIIRGGFPFNPSRHLPAAASECLMTVLVDEPQHLPTLRLLDTMLRPVLGMEQVRVGFLSILTLHERKDWRLAFEIALANLKSYRLESGLEELALAHGIAREQGQGKSFERALAARDVSGLLVGAVHG
ncbi:glycosyltransferase [uncultured Pseudodesulfovibrio sp.]|uniref:glycosyltransferase family protein n=1 Tax=uncultured Pseudodesulfovibrio sp. TaxID=2035858 RepID=UPI0029C953CF|nr:glycosyltransferase [uncultured Pseudodesulfovibrio sp.]